MKKSISYWSFPGGLDGIEAGRRRHERGEDRRLRGDRTRVSASPAKSRSNRRIAQLAKVRQASKDIGIEIASLGCALHFQWPFTSDDAVDPLAGHGHRTEGSLGGPRARHGRAS